MPSAHSQVQRVFGRTITSQHTYKHTQIRRAIDSYMLAHFITMVRFYGYGCHPSLPLPHRRVDYSDCGVRPSLG